MPFRIIRKLISSVYIAPFFQRLKALSRNHLINLWLSCRVASQGGVCARARVRVRACARARVRVR